MKSSNGKSRGFDFVEFTDSKAVDKALLQKPHIINDRTIEVERAVPKENTPVQSGSNSISNSPGMSSFNRNNSKNYSTANSRPPPLIVPLHPIISSSTSSYGQQGINSNASHFNPPIPRNAIYSQSFDSMSQNQFLPPSMSQRQSIINYDIHSNTSNMPFNNNPNQSSNSNYMQPFQSSYGQNQQQNFENNSNNFGGMNHPFILPSLLSSGNDGYNNVSSISLPFYNFNSSRVSAQNYDGENYNNMPQQSSSHGGGPMHERRDDGGSYGNRSVPYSARGDCHVCSDRGRGEQSIFYINY